MCFAFVSFSVIEEVRIYEPGLFHYVNSEMSLPTSRVTVNDNNPGTQVPLSHTFSSPLGFTVPS